MTIETEAALESVEALAEVLNGWIGIMAKVSTPVGGAPFLKVQNLQVPMLAVRVIVQDGEFAYSWGKKIGPVAEFSTVAFSIVRTLRDQSA